LQRSHLPQEVFGDHGDKLKNERSTAGFRFNAADPSGLIRLPIRVPICFQLQRDRE
jgi:hypothetical protein